MRIIADTHTHTLASDHAHSTITENLEYAAGIGLKYLCMTEHTHSLPGAPTSLHFSTLKYIPRIYKGVTTIRGAEVNILNSRGELDLANSMMDRLEWVIASMHAPVYIPETKKEHTKGWLNIAENPRIDVIGHCGDPRYVFDHIPVLKAFAKHGKIVEINSHSFDARAGSDINCEIIAKLCAEIGVPIVISSDAHYHMCIGEVENSIKILKKINFPLELILNLDEDRFLQTLRKINGESFLKK